MQVPGESRKIVFCWVFLRVVCHLGKSRHQGNAFVSSYTSRLLRFVLIAVCLWGVPRPLIASLCVTGYWGLEVLKSVVMHSHPLSFQFSFMFKMRHCIKVPPLYVLCVLRYLRVSFQGSFKSKEALLLMSREPSVQVTTGFGRVTDILNLCVCGGKWQRWREALAALRGCRWSHASR